MDRGVAEAHLVEERQQERHPADAQARDEAADDGDAERPDPEQREAEQGMGRLDRVPPVRREQHERDGQEPGDLAHAQRVLAEDLEDVREERDAGTEEHEARHVERRDARGAVVRQMAVDHVEARQPDREIDEEDHSPVQEVDDEALRPAGRASVR